MTMASPRGIKFKEEKTMTMYDIAKKWVPNGCKLELIKEKASEFECKLVMGNHESRVWIRKTCAPGKSIKLVKTVICSGMMGIWIDKGDLQKAEFWSNRMRDLKSWKKDDLEP